MNQLNSIILEGNLVKDCTVSEPSSGFLVCKFTIGVNRSYKNRENEFSNEVSYFDIESYGNIANYAKAYALKGRGVRIVGRLKQNRYIDGEGKSHSKVFVVAEHIEYKPVRKEESQNQIVEESSDEVVFQFY